MKRGFVAGLLAAAAASQSACIAVGYRSGGGLFVWPRGLGLIVLIVIVVILLARRGV
jgi:hypothetical protein